MMMMKKLFRYLTPKIKLLCFQMFNVMLVGGRGRSELLGYGRAAIRPLPDVILLPSPRQLLARG